ncbi:MAG: MarR family transcriptional regulator [Sphingomonadales bacterium]|nr:MarR family transcriptional regulator [Sphingomonadales bacterium]NCP41906.1 MarR family transcriptional regulator [Sphingomonadales bacterium]NCP47696.1 MarR family transcriptional regulator [Sphingomonadales bacterium]
MEKKEESQIAMDQVEILIDLLKVATRISRPMRDGVADPEDISVTELRILMALGGEGALAGIDLAELMAMQAMNVSRALNSLEKMGFVELTDNQNNRRRKPYQLSKAGRAKCEQMSERIAEVARFVFGKLTDSELRRVDKLLRKIDGRLIEWESPPDLHHVKRA